MTSSPGKLLPSACGGQLLPAWLTVLLLAAAVATAASAFSFDAAPAEPPVKRQIPQPPVKPDRFTSVEQFDTYMRQLEAYLKLIGRQRFGKRSQQTHPRGLYEERQQHRWGEDSLGGDWAMPSDAAAYDD